MYRYRNFIFQRVIPSLSLRFVWCTTTILDLEIHVAKSNFFGLQPSHQYRILLFELRNIELVITVKLLLEIKKKKRYDLKYSEDFTEKVDYDSETNLRFTEIDLEYQERQTVSLHSLK